MVYLQSEHREHPSTAAALSTSRAIRLAFVIGLPIGVFLRLAVDPFAAWFLMAFITAFGGAVVVTAVLCMLANKGLGWIGVAYSAGAAIGCGATNGIAHLVIHGFETEVLRAFALIIGLFVLFLFFTALTTCICGILK